MAINVVAVVERANIGIPLRQCVGALGFGNLGTNIAGNDRLFCDVLPGKEAFAGNTGFADPDVHLHATLLLLGHCPRYTLWYADEHKTCHSSLPDIPSHPTPPIFLQGVSVSKRKCCTLRDGIVLYKYSLFPVLQKL